MTLEERLLQPDARARIAPHLDPSDNYERIVSVISRLARRNPEIKQCIPGTIIDAAATIVGWNLEIGETAHIVPFNVKVSKRGEPDQWEKRAQAIMDYKGMAQILVASKVVRAIEPWIVYEKDVFEISGGTDSFIRHSPTWKGDRGAAVGAYIVFRLPMGMSTFRYMTMADIDKIRREHSKQWKHLESTPDWYALKTVMRQSRKYLSSTPALSRAFAAFGEDEAIELGEVNAGGISGASAAPEIGSVADTLALPAGPAVPDEEREDEIAMRAARSRGPSARRLPTPPPAPPVPAPAPVLQEREPGEEEPELFQDDRDLDDYRE